MFYGISTASQKLIYGLDVQLFSAFLACPYKAFLIETANPKVDNAAFEFFLNNRLALYAEAALADKIGRINSASTGDSSLGRHERELNAHYQPLKSIPISDPGTVFVEFGPATALRNTSRRTKSMCIPTLFLPTNKIRKKQKLQLAFIGLLISKLGNSVASFGNIICSSSFSVRRIQLQTLYLEARRILRNVAPIIAGKVKPPLILNTHCKECRFSSACRSIATEKDDLSLLGTLSKRQILNLNKRGIYTVLQLSHTFRPRRARRKKAKKKHDPALKALAIRESKIYVKHLPELPKEPVQVFLDVEGTPDLELYYLIGMKVCERSTQSTYSLWANQHSDEARIWNDFLSTLASFETFALFHYGSYESTFVKAMFKRHGGANWITEERLLGTMSNVLAKCYLDVYFPTYSNGLKDIAGFLGFDWNDSKSSGLWSIEQRYSWERNHDSTIQEGLLQYNIEDCDALQLLTETLFEIADQDSTRSSTPIVKVENIRLARPLHLGNNTFNMPEFDYINKCAYFDYQRSKIFWRTDDNLRKAIRRKARKRSARQRANKVVRSEHSRRRKCPYCRKGKLVTAHAVSKTTYDLKFTPSGVKRWVVKYVGRKKKCKRCKKLIAPRPYPDTTHSYQHGLLAWITYQSIEMVQSHESILQGLNELFGFDLEHDFVHSSKKRAAAFYQPAYDEILQRIQGGPFVHIDETRANTRVSKTGDGGGYVWVFTNHQDVVYVYTDTREGDIILKTMGESFCGVLISDFYTAYDGLPWPQQRCLIHLIRDLNDDLFKNPFDEELKLFVAAFGNLLKPIIATVDRHGLKCRFLRKHKNNVDRFFRDHVEHESSSEIAAKYKVRFKKNKSRLFTFLDYDGIPWNNNNAEHAIKAFARIRKALSGLATPDSLRRTLLLLSIRQTLRNRNISFLEFLKSGKCSLNDFLQGG